ncbi:hypothetical protein D6833_04855, partial [Candidatus Parcubacteria bacterium]
MKSVVLFLLLILAWPVLCLAQQPQHFSFKANTGDSYSIVVTAATLDGVSLTAGDEIAVLAPGGLVVGASVWT